ncbi:MAG: spore coat biosynthesis protein F [Crocinitomicaceae bacterium]|nr:spore coat biosynthesis protein F [Crocinitomicaceae bacterium]
MKKNRNKVVALVQARLGSTRLPNKMMLSLKGTPILQWVLHRLKKSTGIDEVVLATSTNEENDLICDLANELECPVYRGDEDDVLKRFYEAALTHEASHIVRICADNPLVSPAAIDQLIEFYFKNQPCDYAYNHIPRNNQFPDGLGAEMISVEILQTIHQLAKQKEEREHCFNYIVNRPEEFNISTFDPKETWLKRPELKFDVDTFDDYYKLQRSEIDMDIEDKTLVDRFS